MTTEITYAEVQGAPPFDWNKFLQKPRRSKADWDNAYELSGKWVTCACGNQCAALPREGNGRPKDFELRKHGFEFHEAIAEKDIKAALLVLAAIEGRAAALLAGLPNK